MKWSRGHLVPPQRLQVYSELYPVSYLTDTETPPAGEDNCMASRIEPRQKLLQFWEFASKMETNWPWNWKWTGPKATKMTLIRPPTTNLKMTFGADHLFLHATLPLSMWNLFPPHCPGGREPIFGQTSSSSPVAGNQNKATFLPTNLASLRTFGPWEARSCGQYKAQAWPVFSIFPIKRSTKPPLIGNNC